MDSQPILGDKVLFLYDVLVVCPKIRKSPYLSPPLICANNEEI
jgi:hypothetical protein